jgi:hypothetical protein
MTTQRRRIALHIAASLLVLFAFAGPAAAQGPVMVGGSVFLDDDHDNRLDTNEIGVDGVTITVYDAMMGFPLGTVVSGDTLSPAWSDCVAQNPGIPLQGLYCFPVPGWSYYYAEVDAANFAPAGALEGLWFTAGGNTRLALVYDASALGLDLGYHQVPGVGDTADWQALYDADRWPFASNFLGGAQRSAAELNGWLEATAGNDQSIRLIQEQIAGVLNVFIGNDPTCIQSSLAAANQWLATNPPGSGVSKSSSVWKQQGLALYNAIRDYNLGLACAPSRTDL